MTTGTSRRAYVEEAGVVPMALSVEEAFPLFNAEGERRWVAGWNPHFLRPTEPKVGEGVVFQTVQPDVGTATWVQTRHEPAAGLASFVYIVPDHRAVMVDIDVTPDGEGRSLASVTYHVTSLSSDADDFVRAFAAGFTDMMAHWVEAIPADVPSDERPRDTASGKPGAIHKAIGQIFENCIRNVDCESVFFHSNFPQHLDRSLFSNRSKKNPSRGSAL